MTMPLHPLLEELLALIFPPSCVLCETPLPCHAPFCMSCRQELTATPGLSCPRCASSVGEHQDLSQGCVRCRNTDYRFSGVVRFGSYTGLVRDAILKIKSSSGEVLAARLGELWVSERPEQLVASTSQIVIPVPLHWRRRWARGYNQADELALAVARGLGLPCRRRALRRIRPTPKQSTTVSPAERRANMQGVFQVRHPQSVSELRVLLVDDVLTTGATADACAIALLAAGAAQVSVAAFAHR